MPIIRDVNLFEPKPLRIRCPNKACGAGKGAFCRTPKGKFVGVHTIRWDAWEYVEALIKLQLKVE